MPHNIVKISYECCRASCANREECSEIDESSQSESEGELNDSFESDHEFDSDYENYSSSTNEEEDHLNSTRGRMGMRLLADSEDDSEESTERQNIEIAFGGTVWKKIETSSSPDRPPLHPDSFGDYLHSNAPKRHLLVEIDVKICRHTHNPIIENKFFFSSCVPTKPKIKQNPHPYFTVVIVFLEFNSFPNSLHPVFFLWFVSRILKSRLVSNAVPFPSGWRRDKTTSSSEELPITGLKSRCSSIKQETEY
ncbi:hypothetical protein AVEN_242991-1 [Araneus ventricosus]|uniref:PiggyBac transposable element-derived protein domain-containing protein n=1 Tax=Araneus ventricosus TaxID=182803 RepID=A0A4Y2D575_ARAVE|nr:hypothetical protein AVEN_242991-1 [Araneus ventricosus]